MYNTSECRQVNSTELAEGIYDVEYMGKRIGFIALNKRIKRRMGLSWCALSLKGQEIADFPEMDHCVKCLASVYLKIDARAIRTEEEMLVRLFQDMISKVNREGQREMFKQLVGLVEALDELHTMTGKNQSELH